MVYAAIVAGGSGLRMGADLPKQFLMVSKKPVLIHTALTFTDKADKIVIVCHADYVEYTKKLLDEYKIEASVIPGGKDRMESVKNAVDFLIDKGASGNDVILTHDGVRPFVTEKMIDESIENAVSGSFSTVAVNSSDTVCLADDGENIDSVPKRAGVFSIQTPQTFTIGKLKEMLDKCCEGSEFTDLCGLAISMGEKVKIVAGSPENIKITFPADVKIAELILEKRNENR